MSELSISSRKYYRRISCRRISTSVAPKTEHNSSGSQVHEVIARDNALYFLVAPGSTPENTRLIRTSVVGKMEKIIDLGPDYVTNVLTDDATGDLFVSSVNLTNVSKLTRLTSEGRIVSETPIDTLSPNRLMFRSRGIITVSSAGRVSTESGTQLATLPAAEGKGPRERVLTRGEDEMAYINMVSGAIEICDLASGGRKPIGIQEKGLINFRNQIAERNRKNTSSTESTLLSVAADAKGNLYLLRNGFNPQRESAPLVVIHPTGDEDLLLCRLQTLPGGKLMIPTFLAVNKTQVFFVDSSGAVLVFYKPQERKQ